MENYESRRSGEHLHLTGDSFDQPLVYPAADPEAPIRNDFIHVGGHVKPRSRGWRQTRLRGDLPNKPDLYLSIEPTYNRQMNFDNAQAASLLSLSAEELFAALGASTRGHGAAPTHGSNNKLLGKEWYHRNLDKIRGIICPHPAVVALLESDREFHRAEIVILIAEILSEHRLTFAPLVLSALLIKEGLGTFCSTFARE